MTVASMKQSSILQGVAPKGSVLQVVSTTKTDAFTTTSTSYADVTGLSATITPISTSSRIEVSVVVPFATLRGTVTRAGWSAFRGSTNLVSPSSPGSRTPAAHWPSDNGFGSSSQYRSSTFQIVDSPGTTSELTYKVMAICESGQTAYVNRSEGDNNASDVARGVSTIILMEVAG